MSLAAEIRVPQIDASLADLQSASLATADRAMRSLGLRNGALQMANRAQVATAEEALSMARALAGVRRLLKHGSPGHRLCNLGVRAFGARYGELLRPAINRGRIARRLARQAEFGLFRSAWRIFEQWSRENGRYSWLNDEPEATRG